MKTEKIKRNFWLTTEIECMLSLIKEVQAIQGTTATTNYTFVQIANRMKKRGFPNKTATQIRRKWFQMKSAYLCFKRGKVERLLLIPEKFRGIIAEFVEAEYKHGKVAATTKNIKTEHNQIKPDPVENSYHHQMFTKILTHIKHNQQVINNDFRVMQEDLMEYDHKCQQIRDCRLITFLKNKKYT